MQATLRKRIIAIATVAVIVLLVVALAVPLVLRVSGSERYFSGEAEVYYNSLIERGFPQDYAVSLTELHLLHPNWEFEPLLITEEEPQYTWNYVIDKETEKGETNVVYSNSQYAAYHHPLNRELYDSGYYQASRATVEYFMDPRNFLNETDIFQFYTLSGADNHSTDAVEAILAGTFMENTKLENGMTYAAYFVELGKELDVNPVFLAAKVRQEQGSTGISPIISGTCGSKLWEFYRDQTEKTDTGQAVLPPATGYTQADLLALNGYYNYFNVGATGKGVFQIYYNAMQYAQKGTAAMSGVWGGSPAWNTRWKALYGGTYFLKTSYIDCYQSTVYLQKFNVDSRASTNFNKQYMTAVFGAMSEGRALYQSFATLDALDAPATFLIPVYGEMPTKPCADPANGKRQDLAQATVKYSYQTDLTAPQRVSAQDAAIYATHKIYPGASLKLDGTFSHDYTVERLEYAWDGGEWQTASNTDKLDISLFIHFPENTSHILTIRGKATYDVTRNGSTQTVHTYVLCGVIYVNVVTPPSVTLSYEVGNTTTERTLYAGSTVTLPLCEASDFAGWYGSDGSFLPSGADFVIESDLTYSAVFLEMKALDGAALNLSGESPALRFSAVMDADAYRTLTANDPDAVRLTASVLRNGSSVQTDVPLIGELQTANGQEWVSLSLDTPALLESNLDAGYRTIFYAELYYTNGSTATVSTEDTADTRSARQVAQAALDDPHTRYPAATLSQLRSILETQ